MSEDLPAGDGRPRGSRWRPRRQPGRVRRQRTREPPRLGPPKRVGHKGTGLLAPPGNTLQAFDTALAIGVDMLEFDVLQVGTELLLAHDPADAERADVLTLDQALAHLTGERFAGIEFDVDVKAQGYELQVVAALREHGLLERCLISSTHVQSLRAIRRSAPRVRLGLSVPRLRRDPFAGGPLQRFAPLLLRYGRAVVPGGANRALKARICDAMMVHWRLVTPRLIRAVAARGGELYVWTVDNLEGVERLYALGVSGIISNDPRLFALAQAQSVRLPADEHRQ